MGIKIIKRQKPIILEINTEDPSEIDDEDILEFSITNMRLGAKHAQLILRHPIFKLDVTGGEDYVGLTVLGADTLQQAITAIIRALRAGKLAILTREDYDCMLLELGGLRGLRKDIWKWIVKA